MNCETITREIDVRPTPEELARIWCDMDSDEQAVFFNEVARISSGWDAGIEFQLQKVTDSIVLTKDGSRVMEAIGAYAYPGR